MASITANPVQRNKRCPKKTEGGKGGGRPPSFFRWSIWSSKCTSAANYSIKDPFRSELALRCAVNRAAWLRYSNTRKSSQANLLYIYHAPISIIPFLPLGLLSLCMWLSNVTEQRPATNQAASVTGTTSNSRCVSRGRGGIVGRLRPGCVIEAPAVCSARHLINRSH